MPTGEWRREGGISHDVAEQGEAGKRGRQPEEARQGDKVTDKYMYFC